MSRRVLVFGSTGQVARELARSRWAEGFDAVFLDRSAADLGAPDTLAAIVSEREPAAVVIAAAYTAVDEAEHDEPRATVVNAGGPGAIAAAAARLSVPVVHVSTDYVFDGTKEQPYDETDPTCPINAYGRSKLAGEIAVQRANPRHAILRTSWLYSSHGSNFLLTMLRLAASRDAISVVDDQLGCPTSAGDLAQAIADLVPAMLVPGASFGTYHLAGRTEATRHRFAEAIFAGLAERGLRRPRNLAITSRDYPTPARRPMNSRLSCGVIEAEYGLSLPGFDEALPRVLDEALAARAERVRERLA